MQTNLIAENFLSFAAKRMTLLQREIAHCLDQLSEEQMWFRGGDYENSVANLLLHLEGNIRQWILHGIDDQPDVRERDGEFTLVPSATATEARTRFNSTLEEAVRVISALESHRLLVTIDPQPTGTWRHATILEAVFKVTGHLEMHTGQIILLTKQFLAADLDLTMPRKR